MNSDRFFSGSRPALINNDILLEIDKQLEKYVPENMEGPDMSIFQPPSTQRSLSKVYENYIKPNLFPIIVLLLLGLYLFMRYTIKNCNEEDNEEEFATLKPHVPVKDQPNYTNYVPNVLDTIRVDGKHVSYNDLDCKRDLIDDDIIDDDYSIDHWDNNLNSGCDSPRTGMFNSWETHRDTNIKQPYYQQDDFIRTTNEAVEYATDRNRQNFNELAATIFNEDNKVKKFAGYNAYNS
jgi:hypothetical protein